MQLKLTMQTIKGITFEEVAPKGMVWDTDITGFGLRVYPSGKKSFILSYRVNDKKTLYTIGQFGRLTLEQARELAKKRFGEVADLKDPLLERKKARKKKTSSVNKLVPLFIEKYAKENTRHWQEAERIYNKDMIPAIGKKAIDEVSKDDIIKILDKIVARKAGIMANRTLAHMQKFFNWCIERNLIENNPAYKLAAPAKNKTRDRVITDCDLKDIWLASNEAPQPFKSIIKILILTGQRRGEVASMRWQDIDFEAKLWTIPREMNKSDREHKVPLSDLAISIIKSMEKLGEYIFSSSGQRPFENFSRDRKILDKLLDQKRKTAEQVKIKDWHLHDIRRSVASGMAKQKVPPHVVEKLLNHSSGIISGVAAVYNRYQYLDEMKEAIESWSNYLEELLASDIQAATLKLN